MSDYFDAQEPDDVTLITLECPDCGETFYGIDGEHDESDCPGCAYRISLYPDGHFDELPF